MLGVAAMAGVAFMLLTSDWDWNPLSTMLSRIEPTNALITDVTESAYAYSDRDWRELRRRTLSQAQRERLAAGLLDRRRREGWFDRPASLWLRQLVLAEQLPAEMIDRYYREGFSLEIVAPTPVRLNRDTTFTIRGHCRYDPGRPPGLDAVFILEAVYVDDVVVATDFKDGSIQYAGLLDTPKYEILANWTPRRAGSHTIRAVGWYAVGNALASETVSVWHFDDHSPVLPASTEWMNRVAVQRTVYAKR